MFMIKFGEKFGTIFRQNLGRNTLHRTVVICTLKIQIYLRVFVVIFHVWKYLSDTRI